MVEFTIKKLGSIVVSLVLFLGMLPFYPKIAGAEDQGIPVPNSDFEEGLILPGWNITSGEATVSGDMASDGRKSLQMMPAGEKAEIQSHDIKLQEGSYVLTAQVHVDKEEAFQLGILFYDQYGTLLREEYATASGSANWQEFRLETEAPTETDHINLVVSSRIGAHVDNVKLLAADTSEVIPIENSSFESDPQIPEWISTGSLVTVALGENGKHLRIYDTSVDLQVQAKTRPISITGGKTYKMTAKMNVKQQSHSVEAAISFYDRNNKQVGFKNELHKAKAGLGWIDISLEDKAPADAATMQIAFSSGKPSITDVYVDDVNLEEIGNQPPEEEISEEVPNPGFEMPLTDDGSIPGWKTEGGAAGVSISQDLSRSGTQSLHFHDSSDKSGLRVISDKISIAPGRPYLATAYTNAVQQTHNIVYEIHYYNGQDQELKDKVKIELFGNLPKNQWNELKVFTDTPADAAYARLAFYSGGISLTEAYFDDVSFELAKEEVPLEREYAKPVKLGPMVQVQLGQAAVIQENELGENEVYYHSNGLPGTFSVLDAETGKLKYSQVIPNTEALWAMTVGPDKNVYFASTGDGKLYRYVPSLKKIEELGVNPSDDWVWDLEASSDGKIYGSTYPHASLFEYDIAAGTFKDYGQIKEGQQYARGIGVTEDAIYVGIGTTKHLLKIDRKTGAKEEIIIEGHSGEEGMIENIFVIDDKLFVSAGSVTMLVVDSKTNKIVDTFQYSNMISSPSPLNPDLLYYKFENRLYQYNVSTNKSAANENIPLLPDTVRVKDMQWITPASGEFAGSKVLAMVTQYGEYMLYNPETNELKFIELDISSQAVAIQALKTGPDGKLYMGGYQRGMSIYNPFTEEIEVNAPSFAQPEGIGFLGDKVFYGTYVGAIMYSFDPSKPIDLPENPALEYDIQDQQDRPFAITNSDDQLFVGTVPDYGVLGGVLATYDKAADKWTQYRNVVQDQSIIGLAYKDGMLYGGTSVWGGLGIDPKASAAKIFVWDVEKGMKIEEFTPEIPGIDETPKMIGELSFGPDGNLWGAVDGTIFAMNPDTKEVVKSKVIRPSLYNSSKWFPYRLQWGPDGMLYTTLSRKLIAIDPESLDYQVIVEDFMNNMTVGTDGSIYYALGNELFKIAVPETDATLQSIQINGMPLQDFSPGVLHYQINKTVGTVEAKASQTGAEVDVQQNGSITLIRVTAPDGKSVKEYEIRSNQDPAQPEYPIGIDVLFKDKRGNSITKLTPQDMVTAEVSAANTRNKKLDILILMELIDESGKVVDQTSSSRSIPASQTKTMTAKLKLPADINGYKLRVTAWEGKKQHPNMTPLSKEHFITE